MAFNLGWILPVIFIFGMAENSIAQSFKENARSNLKKWGVAYCISQTVNASKIDSVSGSAQAAYFELGAHKGEAYETIKRYIDSYTKMEYNGKQHQDLSMQKCLDLIDSKEYTKKIKFCDKWLIRRK